MKEVKERKGRREKSWCINRSCLSTLQTVMANRRCLVLGLQRKWALEPPGESNPRHLLCYIVTRKLHFSKWRQRERRKGHLSYLAALPIFWRPNWERGCFTQSENIYLPKIFFSSIASKQMSSILSALIISRLFHLSFTILSSNLY